MRGKVPNRRSTETKPGITPAYAGKSTCLILFDTLLKDHPRVCGEKRCCTALCRPGVGSPPRMRGKANRGLNKPPVYGITPAYAGKSRGHDAGKPAHWDHPRVCGEKWAVRPTSHRWRGSPPRMRGKAPGTPGTILCDGITPAYAGKRLPSLLFLALHRDHPRVCGEKAATFRAVWVPRGSPPRMRGKAFPSGFF